MMMILWLRDDEDISLEYCDLVEAPNNAWLVVNEANGKIRIQFD